MAGYKDSDYIAIIYSTTDDTYQFYKGGTAGTFVGQIVLVYSDTTKATMVKVVNT